MPFVCIVIRDECILGIPNRSHVSHGNPMGMGIVKLISWEWELLEGNENSTFSHLQSNEEKQPVSGVTSASLGTSANSDTLDCHSPPAKKRRVFDFKDPCDPEDD